jgi:hypothetical protein
VGSEARFRATPNPKKGTRLKTSKTTLPFNARRSLVPLLSLAIPFAGPALMAEDAPPPSKVHALFNLEFSDKYLTPRGMIVQDQGLVFQPLFLAFASIYSSDNFSITAVGGVWNCFGTSGLPSSDSNGAKNTSWYEIDPIAGLSFGFAKNFTLDVTYTAFNMEIFNIPFSQHIETKLSFNDSSYLGAFALHPSVIFWKEIDGKAVANTDAVPSSSHYFDLGIAPSYTFESISLKVEAPCRMLMADEDFYGTGAGAASTVGLFELGLKGSMPLKFMPQGYGNWSAHAGFKYMNLMDDNLKATQGKSEVWQVLCGISTFF